MSETGSSARAQILNGIRRSLRRGELAGPAREAVEARLAAPLRGPLVARAQLPQPEKIALFCQWAEANNATVARVAPAEVPAEVTAYLARNNLPATAAMAPAVAMRPPRRDPPASDARSTTSPATRAQSHGPGSWFVRIPAPTAISLNP